MTSSAGPVARTTMMIRRRPEEVYEAFVDPAITCRFWFSRGSGRLEVGGTATWYWYMYGVEAQVEVDALEPGRRIALRWPTPVEWSFEPVGDGHTQVTITAGGFTGSDEEKIATAIDAMGGFSYCLAGCKAWLEHGLDLRLTLDHRPDAHVEGQLD